jgi:RNA polymerase sigma-B factor
MAVLRSNTTTETNFSTGSGRVEDSTVLRWIQEYVQRRDLYAPPKSEEKSAAPIHMRPADAAAQSALKAQIAHHFTSLVESVARRFNASGEPFEDLVQEGFLGLLSALEHFDPNKGVKFSTYATHFVAGAIRHCLRDRGKIIKEPAWLHDLSGKIARTADTLQQTLGRPAEAAEIAQTLNLKEEAVEEILSTRQVFQVAAFGSSSDDGDDNMMGLVDPEKIRSDKYVTLQLPIEDRIVLEEASLKLKALEQKVLYEFFYKDHNQTEIAKKLGISCNYVSHILKNSTKKLRKVMGEADVLDRGRAQESSIVDAVSGLYTAPHVLSRLEEELSRGARANQPTAVLLVIIEGLSVLTPARRDEAWHACGEAVRRSIRRMDLAGRCEDDCILVLLPHTGEQASIVGQRLTDVLLAAGAVSHARFTVCTGLAVAPEQGRSGRDLIEAARTDAGLFSTDETRSLAVPPPSAAPLAA